MVRQANRGTPASQEPPPEPLDDAAVEEVGEVVMAASRLFVAISARSLAAIDTTLTLPQLRTLVVLDGEGPVKLAALAAALDVNPSTAMRMVDKLAAHALVDRQVNPGNRREVVLRLTPEGAGLVERVMDHRRREIRAIVSRLPADQRTGLIRSLRALAGAADEALMGPEPGPAERTARSI
ncbi:MarR family transcriptional regulator [Streptomyces sp. PTM05]|uniref:MarR family transcriptional regulator n=1 Tax=Streptantibioticus parmotrematis TaxID=2873249 RepID=A0ABS7QQT5_9ACTN|nr:MarR family transcriptional regulator [Streptantibioticus parmotrematis]MBY8885535.1 MarR family transcriptional regulator [Streptantibioticus parmotrematis]